MGSAMPSMRSLGAAVLLANSIRGRGDQKSSSDLDLLHPLLLFSNRETGVGEPQEEGRPERLPLFGPPPTLLIKKQGRESSESGEPFRPPLPPSEVVGGAAAPIDLVGKEGTALPHQGWVIGEGPNKEPFRHPFLPDEVDGFYSASDDVDGGCSASSKLDKGEGWPKRLIRSGPSAPPASIFEQRNKGGGDLNCGSASGIPLFLTRSSEAL
ncbi:hypothetical protein CRG98_024716 [Punica granatum]|uniref:Uncharacterized protein n=1 Tax=Punica granatum TaxID=22663 RepID=A0A2I0JF47_PUNGR|nr:hypothetical protein CRG98_024716 [Punica granatum]